ncbi:hypothetical protein PSE_2739 [Pseudovibrio sp. FO-BEG1]|nr:hypothetical protein PSE_2739 [Pseudovibrio sp. FO-BEG1]
MLHGLKQMTIRKTERLNPLLERGAFSFERGPRRHTQRSAHFLETAVLTGISNERLLTL